MLKILGLSFVLLFMLQSPQALLWSADMETGDLSQWPAFPGQKTSHDNGNCSRPENGVSSEVAHSGNYSMKMSFRDTLLNKASGCRQFRYPEIRTGEPLKFSAWYYLPKHYTVPHNNFFMLGQFKSKTLDGSRNDPVWSYQIRNRESGEMYLVMVWNGRMEGPFQGDQDTGYRKVYTQTISDIPVGEWFQVEVYLQQAEDFNGKITVWQNGVQIFDFQNVRTKYPKSFHTYSVTAYGHNISPEWATVYVDDVSISKVWSASINLPMVTLSD